MQSISTDATLWQFFETNVSKTNFNTSSFTSVQKLLIEAQMHAMIARLLWNAEGYFKVYHLTDPMVIKAITIAKQ